jgi:hypothetical protein
MRTKPMIVATELWLWEQKTMVVRTKPRIVETNLWLWEHDNYVCGNKDLGLLAQIYGCGKQKKI